MALLSAGRLLSHAFGSYSAPVTAPLRVASVHNRINNATQTIATMTNGTFRWPHIIGQDMTDLCVSLAGWFLNFTTDTNTGNDYTIIDMALENSAGTIVAPILFAGSRSVTVVDGTAEVISDLLAPTAFAGALKFNRGDTYFLRGKFQVATAGQKVPITQAFADGGAVVNWYNPANTTPSSTDVGGNYTATGTAFSGQITGFRPILLGHPVADGRSFLFTGDSIGAGLNDTGSLAATMVYGRGYFQRAMKDATTQANPLPSLNLCVPSGQSNNLTTTTRWKQYIRYARYCYDEYGHNDIYSALGNQNAASVQARLTTLWGLLRAGGIEKIGRTKITLHTASTIKFASVTISAGGTGYPVSSTFDVNIVGGTNTVQAVARVTTNSSGVVTTFNSMTTAGTYTALPGSPAATTGSTGTGLTLAFNTVTNTGGWYDGVGQTVVPEFDTGGTADTVNTWLDGELSAGHIDSLVPLASLRDPTEPHKWAYTGVVNLNTVDGTHPVAFSYENCATEVRTDMAANYP